MIRHTIAKGRNKEELKIEIDKKLKKVGKQ